MIVCHNIMICHTAHSYEFSNTQPCKAFLPAWEEHKSSSLFYIILPLTTDNKSILLSTLPDGHPILSLKFIKQIDSSCTFIELWLVMRDTVFSFSFWPTLAGKQSSLLVATFTSLLLLRWHTTMYWSSSLNFSAIHFLSFWHLTEGRL